MKININCQSIGSVGVSARAVFGKKITSTDNFMDTDDRIIRIALRKILNNELPSYQKGGHKAEIFEELGVQHGTVRIDFAIVNGIMYGYEIKSDKDTFERLPEQMQEFNAVFDKLTLVVGKRHLYQAMHDIPEWWGIMVAKINAEQDVFFQTIRTAGDNPKLDGASIARLLWREEALKILEEQNEADGVRSKPREFIYKKLAGVLKTDELKKRVSSLLISREGWRSGAPLASSGG